MIGERLAKRLKEVTEAKDMPLKSKEPVYRELATKLYRKLNPKPSLLKRLKDRLKR